jgi:hypothetical protein
VKSDFGPRDCKEMAKIIDYWLSATTVVGSPVKRSRKTIRSGLLLFLEI